MISRKKLEEVHHNLRKLEVVPDCYNATSFYYDNDKLYYVLHCRLKAIIINHLLEDAEAGFPAIPLAEPFMKEGFPVDVGDYYLNHVCFWKCFDLFYDFENWGFECTFLGVFEDEREDSMDLVPLEIRDNLNRNYRYLVSDPNIYIDFEGLIRLPDYVKTSELLNGEAKELFMSASNILHNLQPAFLSCDQLLVDSSNGDAYIHLLFFTTDYEQEDYMGTMAHMNLSFFYAMYAVHLCYLAVREGVSE